MVREQAARCAGAFAVQILLHSSCMMAFDHEESLERQADEASPLARAQPERRHLGSALPIARGVLECGTSAVMQRVRKLIAQSAASDLPVLITGEMGVGKDLVAREIHQRSSRRDKPFLEGDCASLPEDFFGRILFNRESSALSSTDRSTVGQLGTANGATLFLDGLGELSATLQDGLLQLLKRSDATRNGNGAHVPTGIRLISATHHDLTPAVETGSFGENLYYRVNLMHIHVPPLRAHLEDIPALLRYFAQEHGREDEISDDILARICSYEWPGNIRELENVIRLLITLRDPAYVLEELEARAELRREHSSAPPSNGHTQPPPSAAPSATQDDDRQSVDLKKLGREASDLAEKQAIRDMLRRTMGNKKAASQRLGISYKALLYKIRDFGLSERPPAPSNGHSAVSALPPSNGHSAVSALPPSNGHSAVSAPPPRA